MKISVNSPKSNRAVEFENANIGDNFAKAVALNGEAIVFSLYQDAAVVRAQASARLKLDKKNENGDTVFTAEDAITAGATYRPAVAAPRVGKAKDELDVILGKLQAHKAGTALLEADELKTLRKRAKELLEERGL